MIDIIVYVGLLVIIILCGVLNRLRGTGVIKHFGTLNIMNRRIEVKFVGNHLYGLYLALMFKTKLKHEFDSIQNYMTLSIY